jgi:hypothetical protein
MNETSWNMDGSANLLRSVTETTGIEPLRSPEGVPALFHAFEGARGLKKDELFKIRTTALPWRVEVREVKRWEGMGAALRVQVQFGERPTRGNTDPYYSGYLGVFEGNRLIGTGRPVDPQAQSENCDYLVFLEAPYEAGAEMRWCWEWLQPQPDGTVAILARIEDFNLPRRSVFPCRIRGGPLDLSWKFS